MFELMWELRQQRSISDVGSGVRAAEARASNAEGRIAELEKLVQRLAMTCEAMWTLTKDKTGLSDEDLKERVRELDLQDGAVDGKAGTPGAAEACPACRRPMSVQHKKCLYCGFVKPAEAVGPFEL